MKNVVLDSIDVDNAFLADIVVRVPSAVALAEEVMTGEAMDGISAFR